jgi:2-(1,2-epoxy-1,2-dihydrophenyl)acetyl-CoA isomerase
MMEQSPEDAGDASPPTVLVAVEGAVATVRLHRPEHHNAVVPEMLPELHEALADLAGRPEISVVVLTGHGNTFCPGADLRVGPRPGATALPAPEVYHSATLLREMPQITVAAVNGACAGAGLGWAAACDLRFATARAKFSTAFLRLGLSGEFGIAWTLSRLVGDAVAKDLMLIPDKFDAATAHRIGLVSRVFPDDEYAARVDAIVRELAGRDPVALRTIKQSFDEAARMTLREFIDVESPRHLEAWAGERRTQTLRHFARERDRMDSGA